MKKLSFFLAALLVLMPIAAMAQAPIGVSSIAVYDNTLLCYSLDGLYVYRDGTFTKPESTVEARGTLAANSHGFYMLDSMEGTLIQLTIDNDRISQSDPLPLEWTLMETEEYPYLRTLLGIALTDTHMYLLTRNDDTQETNLLLFNLTTGHVRSHDAQGIVTIAHYGKAAILVGYADGRVCRYTEKLVMPCFTAASPIRTLCYDASSDAFYAEVNGEVSCYRDGKKTRTLGVIDLPDTTDLPQACVIENHGFATINDDGDVQLIPFN